MTAVIEAHDLVKTFNGYAAVDRISFAVAEGAIFAFSAPTAPGKPRRSRC
jgi:ABC-type multidrug transport system ATPase subunit